MRSPSSVALLSELGRRDLLEHRHGSGAGDGVAAEGAAEPAGVDGVHHLGAAGHRGERHPATERLAGDEQIRLDSLVVLDRPHRPRPGAARLDLVVHVEDPVLAAERLEAGRVVRGHRDEAALALHRLEHDARDRLRVDPHLEQQLERMDRLVRVDAPVRVRRGSAVDLRRERAEPLLVGDDLRGHRHRQERAAVEAVVEHDDRGPAGRGARDLDRVLDRLGAGVDEERALLALAAGRELGEAAADLDIGLVRADHEALVEVEVDLLVDRGDRGRIVVPEVVAADPAGEVDVAAPVDVLDPRAERARDDEPRSRDPAGHVARALREDAGGRGFLLQGHCSDYAAGR